MSIGKYVKEKADRVGQAVTTVAGAVGLGQMPQFLAQYVQRIGGARDEAHRSIDTLLEEGGKYPVVDRLYERVDHLESMHDVMTGTSGLERIYVFLTEAFDVPMIKATLVDYTAGVTLDPEGLMYLGTGGLAAFLTYELGGAAVKGVKKMTKKDTSEG